MPGMTFDLFPSACKTEPTPKEKAEWKCPKCGKAMSWEERKFWTGTKFWAPSLACGCSGVEEKANHLREIAHTPSKYIHEDLSTWIPMFGTEDLHEKTLEYIANMKENVAAGIGMLIVGPSGTGKTMHLAAIQRRMIESGITSTWINAKDFGVAINQMQRAGQSLFEYLDKLVRIPVLFYDDLGETIVEDWHRKFQDQVITGRYDKKLPVLATSMYSPKELVERLGDHLVSRMIEIASSYIAAVRSKIDMRKPKNRKAAGMKE